MARQRNEENERIKREYLLYLQEAQRRDHKTVDKAAQAILRFEHSTGFKSFKRFHIDQAVSFKAALEKAKHSRTGKPLSLATIDNTLRSVKAFVHWLAGRPGYKSRMSYADAQYFNLNAKDARIAHTHRPRPFPTMEQCQHAFARMPDETDIDKRNKALFAFLMITGARDGAIASMCLSAVDLIEGCIYQDAREVQTKAAKTFTTWFMPTDKIYLDRFAEWVRHLREDLLFGNGDALFPKPKVTPVNGAFKVTGLSRETYSSACPLREIIKAAFLDAGLPAHAPHSFRKTLSVWADRHYTTREGFKAFSQNIGHDSIITTVGAYLPVSQDRQAEIIRGGSST